MISGGQDAFNGSAPWNVAVYKNKRNNGYDLICGGSLISPKLIVSGKNIDQHDSF